MKKSITILISLIIFFFFTVHISAAQSLLNADTANNFTSQVGTAADFTQVSMGTIIAALIQAALGLLAIIFVILIVLSGFRWMTANGNEENVKKAQETLKTAIIGLVIVLAAWSITYFVFTYLPFSGGSSMGPAV
ncbi:MAG: pilin [Patescibacteria group bacterium]|jgi:archaellum component FlaF (FlaF/FlaG flagellin family)